MGSGAKRLTAPSGAPGGKTFLAANAFARAIGNDEDVGAGFERADLAATGNFQFVAMRLDFISRGDDHRVPYGARVLAVLESAAGPAMYHALPDVGEVRGVGGSSDGYGHGYERLMEYLGSTLCSVYELVFHLSRKESISLIWQEKENRRRKS